MPKQRLSNIELLRIISILFVLIGHVSVSLGNRQPASSFDFVCKNLLSAIAVGGVDIFVLISGWFGIHATKQGLGKYIYQVCFLLWLIFLGFAIFDRSSINIVTIKATLWIYEGYWFVMAYLGLYLLSPILNSFVENATKRQYQVVLLAFYIFQCYFSWMASMVDYFSGYSITLFCTLYLTSRYMRLYPIKAIEKHNLVIYAVAIIVITTIVTLSLRYTGTALRMMRYDNPLVILSSLCMLTLFSKLKFQSRVINKLAMSVFAVYIIHFHPFVFPYFKEVVITIFNSTSGIITVLSIFLYLCLVFIICFAVDQLRIITWNGLVNRQHLRHK